MKQTTKQKQALRYTKKIYGCQGQGWGKDEVGFGDQQLKTVIYRMDKQQGLTVQHRELYSYCMVNHNGKDRKKNVHIYTYV